MGISPKGKIGKGLYLGHTYNITVGEYDVLIVPNSYVNMDIPDHSVLIENPAVVHHKENTIEWQVCFTV